MKIIFGAHNALRIISGHVRDGSAQFDATWALKLGIKFNSFDLHRLSIGTKQQADMLRRMLDTAKTQGILEHICCLDLGSIEDSRNANWAQQLTAAIRRMPEVGYYMLGREPNCFGITPENYVRFQKITVPIIRAANPSAKIVMGCIGATHTTEAWDWRNSIIMADKSFDIFSFNWLGLDPFDMPSLDPSKPTWLTELGYPDVDQPHGWTTAAAVALRKGVQRIIFAPWPSGCPDHETHGILNADGTPKQPQYDAMKLFIQRAQK